MRYDGGRYASTCATADCMQGSLYCNETPRIRSVTRGSMRESTFSADFSSFSKTHSAKSAISEDGYTTHCRREGISDRAIPQFWMGDTRST